MFNISGQNVNFVQGGPKTGTLFLYALSSYALISSKLILTAFQTYFTV